MWITSEGSLPTTGYLSSSFTNPPAMMPSTADTVCACVRGRERERGEESTQ